MDQLSPQSPEAPPDFEAFERDWRRKHRSSIPVRPRVSTLGEWFWIVFWLLVATGAAVFSAAHTIPAAELTIPRSVPHRDLLALTAFTIIEFVIFGAAAQRNRIRWLTWLLCGALLVALVGNLGSSYRAVAMNGGDWLNQVGGALLSIIAPVTALAAGEVLHRQLDAMREKRARAADVYQAQVAALDQKINQAYTRFSRNFMKFRETETSSVKFHETPKPRVKLHEIARMVHENGDAGLPAEAMAERYNISLGSTTKVRQILRANGSHG